MDLTPGLEIYEAAARAADERSEYVVASELVDDPAFRAAVDVAYRVGYAQGRDDEAAGVLTETKQPRTPGAAVTVDINELPPWERELLERQAQEMEPGSQ